VDCGESYDEQLHFGVLYLGYIIHLWVTYITMRWQRMFTFPFSFVYCLHVERRW